MSKTSKNKTALTQEQLAKVSGGMRARGWHPPGNGNGTSRAERRGGNHGPNPIYRPVQ
jgi:hypothetical protein